jgi:CBS-domain-containing membrane protein
MHSQRVKDVMSVKVVAVRTNASFKEIVDALAGFKVSAVPVVDDDDLVVGVVSEADLLHKLELATSDLHRRLLDRRQVRDAKTKAAGDTAAALMTAPAITIGPDAPIGEAARLMEHERIKRLPVVNPDGLLIGIVSRRDLLRPYLRSDSAIREAVEYEVLERTLWVNPATIEASVAGGRVTLRGRADRKSTAEIAVRLTRAVDGVVAVVDDLSWAFDDTKEQHRPMTYGDPIV